MRAKTGTTIASALTSTALAIALLTGCGSDGATSASSSMPNVEPAPSGSTSSPSSSASPSAPSSPSTSKKSTSGGSVEMAGAPGVPKKAQKHSKAGAKAFVKYFYGQLNEAWSTPKAGLIEPLSASSCDTCKNFEGTARKGERTGEHLSGPSTKVVGVTVLSGQNLDSVALSVRQELGRRKVVDRSGQVVNTMKAEKTTSRAEVRWTPHGWRMRAIRPVGQ